MEFKEKNKKRKSFMGKTHSARTLSLKFFDPLQYGTITFLSRGIHGKKSLDEINLNFTVSITSSY